MSIRILLIHNPAAGQRTTARVNAVVAALRARGAMVVVRATTRPGEAEEIAASDLQNDHDVIAVAGGDGTLAEVVNGLAPGNTLPLAIVPAGTANVVAHELGLPGDLDQLAQRILAGNTRMIATGSINDRRFVFTVGAGFDAQVVASVDTDLKRRTGRFAYVAAAARALAGYGFDRIRVRIDGTETEAAGVIVLNGRCYGGPFVVAPGNDLGNGRFAVLVLRETGRLPAMGYLAAMASGRASTWRGIGFHEGVREVEFLSPASAPVQADGDYAGVIPVTLRAGTGSVEVIC